MTASLSSPLIKEKNNHMWLSWQVTQMSQLRPVVQAGRGVGALGLAFRWGMD